VRADDVKFSIERAMKKEMRFVFGSELRRMVDRVETVDRQTVIVHLKQPYPALLDRA
jgi:ABC-type transport system substrate-binding protein